MSHKHIVVGTLNGPLASLTASIDQGSLAADKDTAPVIMSGAQVAKLTEDERRAVKSTFEAGFPVVLLEVASDHANALHGVLETGLSHSFAPGVERVEAYGFNREPGGELFQGTFYAPEAQFKASLETNHRNVDGTTVESTIDLGYQAVLDSEDSQNTRIIGLLQWIAEAGKRLERYDTGSAKVKDLGAGVNQLTQLAQAFVDNAVWYSSARVPVSLFPPTFKTVTNQYSVASFCYSCYSQANNSNWFYVQQFAVLNASNQYVLNMSTGQGQYVDSYALTAWPRAFLNQIQNATLIQSSPPTTTGSREVTSSIGYSISGTVGFQQKDGLSGSVTGGMEVSTSQTIQIPDLTVDNRSNDEGNNARWLFTMPRSYGVEDGCRNSISQCVLLSRSTFQPLNQWLWRVVPRADSLAVGMTLEARLVMTTIGSCNAFGCNCDVQQNSEVPTFPLHAFSIPYPPVV